MKRLDNKLKLSVSLLALMSGGAMIALPANAVVISGEESSVLINTDISDLTVDETGLVTPGGILVQGAVAGDVINNGTIEFLDTPTATDTDSLTADAIGLEIVGDIGGDFTNNATINAEATASLTVIGDYSGDAAILEDVPAETYAEASGVWLQGVAGDAVNNGDITATATADTSSDITAVSKGTSDVTGGAYANAEAYGFEAYVTGDFTNAKDASIVSDASASADVIADASGTSASLFNGDGVGSYAYAGGVYLGDVDIATNDGTIGATAEANSVLDGVVTGTAGDGIVDGSGVGAYAYAEGLIVGEDATDASLTNTGSITADAKSTGSLTLDVDATDNAVISGEDSAYAGAVGIRSDGTLDSFTNSGTVSATAASSLTVDAIATGGKGAVVALSNYVGDPSMFGGSVGVAIADLDGTFSNSGAISATNTADLTLVADAAAADVSVGVVDSASGVGANAAGVYIENFDGDFANAEGGEITASASATSSVDIAASGAKVADSDGVAIVDGASTTANAVGVALVGGEGEVDDPDTNTVTNDGTISAIADAASTISASGTSTGTGASGVGVANGMTGALAVGLLDVGETTGFTNTGSITADATASHTATVTGNGDVDSAGVNSGTLYAAAVGAGFIGPVDGNIDNSGTISATASGTYDLDIASNNTAGLGGVSSSNVALVGSLGLFADIEAPSDDEDGASDFVNSGTISAEGDLTIDITQPAATETVTPQQETLGGLVVAGAVVAGDPATIDNSGTISAKGSLNATGVTGDNSTTAAGVVGLWLPEANDGLEITNSGEITAELSGNAEHSAAVGLLLGPLPDGLLESIGGEGAGALFPEGIDVIGGGEGEGEGEGDGEIVALAEGVITVTNTGTISGINTTEGGEGIGIYAETAPVPVIINQQGGLIEGTTAAIAMDQGNADVLNWSGGSIKGLVDADSADVVNVIQALDEDGKGVDTTVTAGTDFTLEGAGQLNVGAADAPVTFVMNGKVYNVGETNLNTDGKLVVGPTGTIDTGTFNQADGSTLVIQFNPTSAGLITTVGDFNADGELQTQAMPGLYGDSGSHVVIDAGGVVAGAFDTVGEVGDTLLIDFTTTVNPSDVVVSWERTAFDEVDGLSDNSKSVATAIEDGYDPTKMTPSDNTPEYTDQIGGLFTITDPELYDSVLNSWSGSEHAQIMRSATNLSEPYLMALGEHLNDNRNTGFKQQNVVMLRPKGSSNSIAPASAVGQGAEDSRFAFWGRGFGRWADTRGDANADGFKEDTYGAVIGLDFNVSPTFLIGIVGSYIDNSIDFDDGDRGKIQRWSIGGYASATFDAFYIDGSFTYASDDYKVNRTILTGGAGCLAYNCTTGVTSDYGGDALIAHAEAGFNWLIGDTARLQPFAGINFTSVDHDGFVEVGGGDLGLVGLDGTGKSFQSRLGARLTGEWGSGDVKWVPELRAEWRHEFKDNPAWIQSSLVGLPSQPFTTVGSHVGRDLAVVGAGISAHFQSGWGLFFDYQGSFASGYSSHIAQGGVRVKF